MQVDLRHGDCLDVMATMEPHSVDAIVTDPPYGLRFMGRHWDHGAGRFIGIDQDAEYCEIARRRVATMNKNRLTGL